MAVYVFDGRQEREWEEMLRDIGFAGVFNNIPEGFEIAANDIAIVHKMESTADRRWFREQAEVGAIVIEVGGGGLASGVAEGNFYRRAKSVGVNDRQFAACFAVFIHAQKSGLPPPWHLLEGPPAPDALLAYHLLSLLPSDGDAKKMRAELAADARREVAAIIEFSDHPKDDSKPGYADLVENDELRGAFLRKFC